MKANEFIQKHKIRPALAAGFKEHLRLDPESDLTEEYLTAHFQEFAGVNLDGSPHNESERDPKQLLSPRKEFKLSDEGLAKARTPKETVPAYEKK
ncbi:hypothetical protein LEP1GSC034_1005 [Leptospira interrogans str. 2003000735]|uniref:Uncharacterized protein n=2 Tax=Leptospira interrogans TaxID=173 RepID=A0A829DBP8_LEPIR|nr:hypothetical protein [Leptospira interrogans]EMY06259.1 hypothetical protein LEP1GSC029_3142 [Leptospira interrogans str. 2002000626]EMY25648.1 hypothetical protein LEP1GSC115_1489 [Leptospira interrogans serovar Australis str. 200703203]EKN89909.1 hypothetical protein LEP1GSC027_3956 [Leptospira interrogans str. 2002000624]EKQ40236.1 hypothetical protein LEP1GSC025_2151 [Leptospira interrogans str. 2002000621]EKQ46088.1 hypothetical protein LEP1GSC026_3150 [Leptospira interrogans str. 2002